MITYPVIHIYPTIQGQGPRMGEVMTLIRTSTPKAFSEFCYFKSTRETPYTPMSITDILKECNELGNEWVFLGGDDPCVSDLNPLLSALKREGFKTWLDTTGIFPCDWDLVDWLSIGPKPLLPLNEVAIGKAHDVRLYYRHTDKEIWEELIMQVVWVMKRAFSCAEIFLAPRILTQECIDAVIQYSLSYKQMIPLRVDIPLFRTLPNFDKNFNKGTSCPICHLMDEFQGCEIKGLVKENKNDKI